MPRIFPAPRPAKAAAAETAQNTAIQTAAQRARKLLNRRALVAAVASTVPVPGLKPEYDLTERVLREYNWGPPAGASSTSASASGK